MVRQMIALFMAMVHKQLLVMLRYPVNFVSTFATLCLIILVYLFAALTFTPDNVQKGLATGSGREISGIILYGFILSFFIHDALWTIGYNVRQEQYDGTLESLYLTPASPFLYLVSRLALPIVWSGLNAIAALLFGWIIFGSLPMANIGLALYILACTLSGVFGFGFCFAGFTLLVKESAWPVANLAHFIILTICAVMFPFNALPMPVQIISRMVPLSYGVDLLRSALLGFPPGFPELARPITEIVIITVWGVLMPLIGYATYRWAEHRVRMNGTLAGF